MEKIFKQSLKEPMAVNRSIQLCPHLKPVYDLEISLSNILKQVEEYAYTKCDLAVVLAKPLHFNEIEKQIKLPSSVKRWENKDSHYSIEAGYFCQTCKHSIAGPN
jgi:hypothetical protein